PGASSIPSSLAIASGFTGSRHMPSVTRIFPASSSISGVVTASPFFPLAGPAFEDLPLVLVKLLLGLLIDFLGAEHNPVGPTARRGELLTFVGVTLLRHGGLPEGPLASQQALDEVASQGLHRRLLLV